VQPPTNPLHQAFTLFATEPTFSAGNTYTGENVNRQKIRSEEKGQEKRKKKGFVEVFSAGPSGSLHCSQLICGASWQRAVSSVTEFHTGQQKVRPAFQMMAIFRMTKGLL